MVTSGTARSEYGRCNILRTVIGALSRYQMVHELRACFLTGRHFHVTHLELVCGVLRRWWLTDQPAADPTKRFVCCLGFTAECVLLLQTVGSVIGLSLVLLSTLHLILYRRGIITVASPNSKKLTVNNGIRWRWLWNQNSCQTPLCC